jgi:hypothetical protein
MGVNNMDLQEDGHITRVDDRSKPLLNAVESIVAKHTGELENVIHKIRDMLKDDTDQLSDLEIDDIMLQLPILLFDVTDDQELVGLQSDLANQIYKEAYSEAYKIARGTVADRTSVAELSAMANKLDSYIYDRAYKIIKQKIEMARETLNAVKKVQVSRQQRYDFGKMGSRF